ncbi:MATE family efflux transporter [Uliginosibacterium gangwonense]|uniref:MATE family efflux transporter n=1 Tax=Uliginosibacterium gangwonense TaxID=392736 RepID=UPI0003753860|nr:MATE family efflux transporter [Uliginosibacterium gangwonense]
MSPTNDSPSSILKPSLIALAWPIFVEQLLHIMTGTVDTFMVSHISDNAVAALGTANQIVVFFIIIFSFVSIGASVVITHHLGGKDPAGADQVATTAIGVNTWIGLIASLLVWYFAEPMLGIMQLSEELKSYALPFLHLMGGTLFLESINFALSAILRAHTHTRPVMLVTVLQNVLNVIGNCILLFGLFGAPKLGVVGVALSTVFSRFVACIALWILVEHYTHLKIRARDFFYLKRDRLGRILHIGLPAAGENISWWLAFMFVTALTARMGDTQLATQSYAFQISMIIMLCGIAIAVAGEIIIGHMIGAGKFEDAYHQAMNNLKFGLVITIGTVILAAILAPVLLDLFTDDPVIIATGALLVRLSICLEPGRTFNLVFVNALRATGDARYPLLLGIASQWTIMVGGAWLLGTHLGWGLPGVWIAFAADEWLRGMLFLRRWRQRKWLPHAKRTHATAQATAPAVA